ncbi:SDR family oxidoreductase, partial [Actinomadura adrarensis]
VAAADGYDVHLHTGSRRADLERTAQRLHDAHGVTVVPHVVDLRSPTAIQAWAQRLRARPPELIVNNASCFPPPSDAHRWDVVRDALALHVLAPNELATVLPGRGHIVNVLDARLPLHDGARTGYEVAKHALAALTLIHARQLAPAIRVNALAPGLVLPPVNGDRDLWQLAAYRAPLQRPAVMEDLGAALRFLDHAPSVTGQILYIDSGEHLGPPARDEQPTAIT